MTRQQTAVRKWLRATTPDQAREVAAAAKTSVPHLRHIAHGRRGISCDLAYRLADASVILPRDLRLAQPALCAACGLRVK